MGLFDWFRPSAQPRRRAGALFVAKLTPEQRAQVLDLVKDGAEIADIAEEMGVHPRTIRRLLSNGETAKTPKQQMDDLRMRIAVEALESDPGARSRFVESTIENLVGPAKDPPINAETLARATQYMNTFGLELVPKGRVQDLERRLAEAEKDLDRARARLARLSDEDSDDAPLLSRFLAPEAQAAIAPGLMTILAPQLRQLVEGMASKVPQVQVTPAPSPENPGPALPAADGAAGTSPAQNLLQLPPERAARLILQAAERGGAVFGQNPDELVPLLLSAQDPAEVASLVQGTPGAEALALVAVERPDWTQEFLNQLRALDDQMEQGASPAAAVTPQVAPSPPAPVGEAALVQVLLEEMLPLVATGPESAAQGLLKRAEELATAGSGDLAEFLRSLPEYPATLVRLHLNQYRGDPRLAEHVEVIVVDGWIESFQAEVRRIQTVGQRSNGRKSTRSQTS